MDKRGRTWALGFSRLAHCPAFGESRLDFLPRRKFAEIAHNYALTLVQAGFHLDIIAALLAQLDRAPINDIVGVDCEYGGFAARAINGFNGNSEPARFFFMDKVRLAKHTGH